MDASSPPLNQYRLAWAVEKADGPACWWPRLEPPAGLEKYCRDRQGMGVPAECLPLPLSCYSVNGWTLVQDASGIRLEPGAPDPMTGVAEPRNLEGCRRHLELNKTAAVTTWQAWTDLQEALEAMAESATASRASAPAMRKRAVRVSGQRWAQYA